MEIFITGVAGFVGFHLAHKLLAAGHNVLGCDNMMSGQLRNVSALQEQFPCNFRFFQVDVADSADFCRMFQSQNCDKLERIYHLACPASPPIYQLNMLHTLDTCYLGSRNLYELAKIHNARILITSTSEIYGDPEVHPQPENYRGNVNTVGPRSCYDEGKRVSETLGYVYRVQHGVEVRIARLFNTYGPRMSPSDGRVMTNFITQALQGSALTIYGDGSQTRSLCYVADTVKGLILLMESDVGDPVNFGSQDEMTISQIAQEVIQLINPTLPTVNLPLPIDDPKLRRPDISLAKRLLNWAPETPLNVGLKSMIEDFSQQFSKKISTI